MDAIIVYMVLINSCVLVGQVVLSVILFRMQRQMNEEIKSAVDMVEKKLESAETFTKIIDRISTKMNKQWASRMSQATKKVKRLGNELGHDVGDHPMMIFFDALGNDDGIIDWAAKNKSRLAKVVREAGEKKEEIQHGPEPEDASMSGEGPPTWWTQEDQEAMEQFVMERNNLHIADNKEKAL